jgi:hypothetical protein
MSKRVACPYGWLETAVEMQRGPTFRSPDCTLLLHGFVSLIQIIHHVTKGRRTMRTQNNKGDSDNG